MLSLKDEGHDVEPESPSRWDACNGWEGIDVPPGHFLAFVAIPDSPASGAPTSGTRLERS